MSRLSIKDVIKKVYLKQKIKESDLKNFINAINILKESTISKINETEEHIKAFTSDFFNTIGYKEYFINTKEYIDLTITNTTKNTNNNQPEVLMEIKKPSNKNEMVSSENLNKKALHELLLYYLREKQNKNYYIRHLIITNNLEWYIFDSVEFDKIATKEITKLYNEKEIEKKLFNVTNEEFYKIIERILKDEKILENIKYVRFNLKDDIPDNQYKYIYKLLSPKHLLKEYDETDSNTLNKKFYNELLYILGLQEYEEGGKKLISRAKEKQIGTLIESTIYKLKSECYINDENKQFEIALELVIIWLNRILFLKLLEAKLQTIHNNDYVKFMNYQIIDDYDVLNTLFFDVLAKKIEDRENLSIKAFATIPYLNSSLFEVSQIEKKYERISNLQNKIYIKPYKSTILDIKNDINPLEYLLRFLNSYDFGSDDISEYSNDRLINSAVLGLIFEKINGYKDGSFYTPSYITMYMTKNTLEQKVLQKYNQKYNKSHKSIDDIQDDDYDKKELSNLIDTITVCDPSVGSGHYLVSMLNEILALKSRLKVLLDENNKRLKVDITVENDELYIEDEDGDIFEYKTNENGKISKDRVRIQKSIFKEKQRIIENQLFGVDINPNSVKITRLRLWIELLKHSYYDENGYLTTLPNIDINIKEGNSLISKYPLKDDTNKKILKEKIEDYKFLVSTYKDTNIKSLKTEIENKIKEIHEIFDTKLKNGSPKIVELQKLLSGETKGKKHTKGYFEEYGFYGLSDDIILLSKDPIYLRFYAIYGKEYNPLKDGLFATELTEKQQKEYEKNRTKALKEIKIKYETIKEIEEAKIYQNSFEWRFEFPEVLDNDGEFIGFDIVVGNPPYGNIIDDEFKEIYKNIYSDVHMRTIDTFNYFISKSINLLHQNSVLSFIVPNNLLFQNEFEKTRDIIINKNKMICTINLGDNVFPDANVPTSIIQIYNIKENENYSFLYSDIRNIEDKDKQISKLKYEIYNKEAINKVPSLIFGINPLYISLIEKINNTSYIIDEIADEVASGISTGGDKIFRVDNETIEKYQLEKDNLVRVLTGREMNKYSINSSNYSLLYMTRDICIDNIPNTKIYLENFREKLLIRSECKKNILPWYSLGRQRYKELFTENKIIIRQTSDSIKAMYDTQGYYVLNSILVLKLKSELKISYKYVLAILNTKLINFIYQNYTGESGRTFAEVKPKNVRKLPIPKISQKEQMLFETLVDEIIEKKANGVDTSMIEAKIDDMVYRLYNLTEEEIKIINENL